MFSQTQPDRALAPPCWQKRNQETEAQRKSQHYLHPRRIASPGSLGDLGAVEAKKDGAPSR